VKHTVECRVASGTENWAKQTHCAGSTLTQLLKPLATVASHWLYSSSPPSLLQSALFLPSVSLSLYNSLQPGTGLRELPGWDWGVRQGRSGELGWAAGGQG
jgi:hypothetical protein